MKQIELRPYQEEAVNKVISDFHSNQNDLLLVLPTGTGKTEVFLEIITRLLDDEIEKSLILVHRDELIQQAYNRMLNKTDIPVGIIKAKSNQLDKTLTLASVQTLSRQKRLLQLTPQDLLVIDEAHHSVAKSYRKIIDHLKYLNPAMYHLGVTATPYRGDKLSLRAVYNEVTYSKSPMYMITNGFSAPITAVEVKTKVNIDSVHISIGDFKTNELTEVVNVKNRNELIVDTFKTKCENRKALVYCVDVKHTLDLLSEFRKEGLNAEMVIGETPLEERKEIYRKLRNDEIDVLINCEVLCEGFDEPSINTILIARPTQSKLLYVQMVGRGGRVFEGKEDCLVVDFTDNSNKYDIMTFPSLVGRLYSDENEHKVRLTEDGIFEGDDKLIITGEGISVQTLSVFDGSPLNWKRYNTWRGEAWITGISNSESVIIKHIDETGWDVWRYKNRNAVKITEFPEPLEIARGDIEKDALKNADEKLAFADVMWHDRFISEKQKGILEKDKYRDVWESKYVGIDEVSRGEASSMLTYLFGMTAIYFAERG